MGSNVHINFPIYRKYSGVDVWFKLLNDREFIEIKRIGTLWRAEHVMAEQYPEMLRIQDMINCHEDRWEGADGDYVEELLRDV